MPQVTDIKTSVAIPSLIKDSFIAQGTVKKNPSGVPMMYTGGFTAVFPFVVNNEQWAFRCWHTEMGNVKQRMELISKDLQKNNLPYFCDFAYVDEGIVVNGKIYPTTRMRWVEGLVIKEYIEKHHSKQDLEQLAANFLLMCKDLHKHHFAHGDLQHGNIMVNNQGKLFLIDYDSMYVPSMQNKFSDHISGLIDYQHPARKKNSILSERVDYFSELIIYISILALANDFSLWAKYQVADTEQMLFKADDFRDLKHSQIYTDLQQLGGVFPLLLNILEEYLQKSSIEELIPFEELAEKYTRTPIIKRFAVDSPIIFKHKNVCLRWTIEDGEHVFINSVPINPTDTRFEETLDSDKQYTLKVVNGLQSVSKTIEVTVVDVPTISLHLKPFKLHKKRTKETSVLEWNISNAQSAKLSFGNTIQEIKLHGSLTVRPEDTTTYTIVAIGLDGKTTFTESATLYILEDSIISFRQSSEYVYPGSPVKLSWDVRNAKAVELVGLGNQPMKGSCIVDIEKETTFTLKVMDHFGIREKQLIVKTLPLPIIKTILVPTPTITQTINIQTHIPQMQAVVELQDDYFAHLDTSKISLPIIEGIYIDDPPIIETPTFHLQLNLPKISWWNKITKQIESLTSYIKKQYEKEANTRNQE